MTADELEGLEADKLDVSTETDGDDYDVTLEPEYRDNAELNAIDDSKEDYLVYAIYDCRVDEWNPDQIEYRISWADFSPCHTSWQPESNLHRAAAMVRQFHRDHPEKPRSRSYLYNPDQAESSDEDQSEPQNSYPDEILDQFIQDYSSGRDTDNDADTTTNLAQMFKSNLSPLEDDPQADWQDYDDLNQPCSPDQRKDLLPNKQQLNVFIQVYSAQIPVNEMLPSLTMSDIYKDLLTRLVQQTSTQAAERHVIPGVRCALQYIRNLKVLRSFRSKDLQLEACSIVITCWLAVCLKIQLGALPAGTVYASDACCSLLATSKGIVNSGFSNDLFLAVRAWESILYKQSTEHWLGDQWYKEIPAGSDLTVSGSKATVSTIEESLLSAHRRDDILQLVDQVINVELSGGRSPLHRIAHSSNSMIRGEMLTMMASANKHVVEACVNGQIARKVLLEGCLVKQAVQQFNESGDSLPAIYGNYVTDKAGMSPTGEMYAHICDDLERYIKRYPTADDSKWAAVVDALHAPSLSWPRKFSLQGFRRYTDWRTVVVEKSTRSCEGRRKIIQSFADCLRRRTVSTLKAGLYHAPFRRPIAEIGYSIRPQTRLKEHRMHRSSNYIMNLTEALLKHRYGGFELTQTVLFVCWSCTHPWLAEIAFTQLSQAYVLKAGGFSHYPAGFSNSSAWHKVPLALWSIYQQKALADGTVHHRLRINLKRIEDEKEAIETQRALNQVTDNLHVQSAVSSLQQSRHLMWTETLERLIAIRQEQLRKLTASADSHHSVSNI